ncbi:MAG: hypothetical protein LBH07_05725, partial [Treponema sp.]|nr:hypothetical protein [Treponema sp.]
IILAVSGIEDTDKFNSGKLLKLEINDRPISTQNNSHMNWNDSEYLNALNGEYVFDITNLGYIYKMNLVFYDCTVWALSVKMFTE